MNSDNRPPACLLSSELTRKCTLLYSSSELKQCVPLMCLSVSKIKLTRMHMHVRTYMYILHPSYIAYLLCLMITCLHNIFQKVSFCVITHLIGQNDRAVCKRHGLLMRCIQCRMAHSASRSGPAGPPGPPMATLNASLSSKYQIDVRAEREHCHRTRKLGHQV